jgi:hypothetical protein
VITVPTLAGDGSGRPRVAGADRATLTVDAKLAFP